MKKLILILCMLPMLVFAQTNKLFVGGSISYTSIDQSKNDDPYTNSNTDVVNFSPMIGYYVSSNFAVGLSGLYNSNSTDFSKSHQVVLSPFVLYHFYRSGNFSLVGKGTVFYQYNKSDNLNGIVSGELQKKHSVGVSVAPGITYDVNRHFRLETYLGWINYSHTHDVVSHTNTNGFGFSLSSSLNFGVLYFF